MPNVSPHGAFSNDVVTVRRRSAAGVLLLVGDVNAEAEAITP
jgi:hypothetical protein